MKTLILVIVCFYASFSFAAEKRKDRKPSALYLTKCVFGTRNFEIESFSSKEEGSSVTVKEKSSSGETIMTKSTAPGDGLPTLLVESSKNTSVFFDKGVLNILDLENLKVLLVGNTMIKGSCAAAD